MNSLTYNEEESYKKDESHKIEDQETTKENNYILKNKLISKQIIKNLIIGRTKNFSFNSFIKKLTSQLSNVLIEFIEEEKIKYLEIKSKNNYNSLFINVENIDIFFSKLELMNLSHSILKDYSLTFLNENIYNSNSLKKIYKNYFKSIIIYEGENDSNIFNINNYFSTKILLFKINNEINNLNINNKYIKSNNIFLNRKRDISYNKCKYNLRNKNNKNYLNNKNKEGNMNQKISSLKNISKEIVKYLRVKENSNIDDISKYLYNNKIKDKSRSNFNNIQRRVYDTINVLQGLNKIERKFGLNLNYKLNDIEKNENILIKKQKELIIKLSLLNYNNYINNIKNYNNLNFNIDYYNDKNKIINICKFNIFKTAKEISNECINYLINKSIFKIFNLNILTEEDFKNEINSVYNNETINGKFYSKDFILNRKKEKYSNIKINNNIKPILKEEKINSKFIKRKSDENIFNYENDNNNFLNKNISLKRSYSKNIKNKLNESQDEFHKYKSLLLDMDSSGINSNFNLVSTFDNMYSYNN